MKKKYLSILPALFSVGLVLAGSCFIRTHYLFRLDTKTARLLPRNTRWNETYDRLPLAFEVNEGQADPSVRFLSRGSGYDLYLTSQNAVLVLRQPGQFKKKHLSKNGPAFLGSQRAKTSILQVGLLKQNPRPQMEPLDPLAGTSNYFIGNDRSKWRTGVKRYGKIRLKDVYPGIDMVYYGKNDKLEYDFIVKAGADPKAIRLTYKGSNEVRVENGELRMKVTGGEVVFKAPVIYQEKNGLRETREGRYAMRSGRSVGFEVKNYDPAQTLVIDPVLDYATYVGGSTQDEPNALAVDSAGDAYITGQTFSADYPLSVGAFHPAQTYSFVTELNPTGTGIVYSSYFGGSPFFNTVYGIAVDAGGDAFLAGDTSAGNFPTTSGVIGPTFIGSSGTNEHGFVTEINPTGTGLVYSTFIGGSDTDLVSGIKVDPSGNAYLVGNTTSADFPISPGAYQTAMNETDPCFVAKLNSTGTAFIYSTFLGVGGGIAGDAADGIAIDSLGNAYVAGNTYSNNFPKTIGTFQDPYPITGYNSDIFVTKINPTGTALVYSAVFGGTSSDSPGGIAVDSAGDAIVAGTTGSQDYPASNLAFQQDPTGVTSSFVTRLNPDGSLYYSTYFGAVLSETTIQSFATDPAGEVYISGSDAGKDFPLTSNAFQSTVPGLGDSFLTEFSTDGRNLIYSTLFGGDYGTNGQGVALDPNGNVYITGVTSSTTLPTTSGAFQGTHPGPLVTYNGYVAKFDSLVFTPTPNVTENCFIRDDDNFNPETGIVTKTGTAAANKSDYGADLKLDGSGRILVAGYAQPTSGDYDMALWRYTNAGILDTSFNGTGYWLRSGTSGGTDDQGNGLVLDGSGNIYVVGNSNVASKTNMTIWSFTSAGAVNTAFNGTGFVTMGGISGGTYGSAAKALIDLNGKLVVVGTSTDASAGFHMTLWRFNPNGTLDTSFGSPTGSESYAVSTIGNNLALDTSGNILAAGVSYGSSSTDTYMSVWRVLPNGSLDTSFNGIGSSTVASVAGSKNSGMGVCSDGTGNILVTGQLEDSSSNGDMAVARFLHTGVLDSSFGTGGVFKIYGSGGTTVTSGSDEGNVIQVDGLNRIWVVGSAERSKATNFEAMTLWRLTSSGSLDSGLNGTGHLTYGNIVYSGGTAMAFDASAKVVIGGVSEDLNANGDMTIWRYADICAPPPTNTPTVLTTPPTTSTSTMTPTVTPTATSTSTGTLTLPTETATMTVTDTFTLTVTPTVTATPTLVNVENICEPYPNPVSQTLHFCAQSPVSAHLTWDVFTTAFRKIASGNGPVQDSADFSWDLTDESGKGVANGLYYLRINMDGGRGNLKKIFKVLVLR